MITPEDEQQLMDQLEKTLVWIEDQTHSTAYEPGILGVQKVIRTLKKSSAARNSRLRELQIRLRSLSREIERLCGVPKPNRRRPGFDAK